jgi:hypothetical protein
MLKPLKTRKPIIDKLRSVKDEYYVRTIITRKLV